MDIDDEELCKYNYDMNNKYLHEIGNSFYNEGKYINAIKIYKELIDNLIDNNLISIIYSNISASYMQLKDYFNSLNFSLIAIQNNNQNAVAWGRVGWSYKGLNENDNALKAFKIALKLNPNNLNYNNEIYNYNSKKIDDINLFDIMKSSNYIINKLKNENFRNKILSNALHFDNLMEDLEVIDLIDYIIHKI